MNFKKIKNIGIIFLLILAFSSCKNSSEEKMLRVLEANRMRLHNYKNLFCADARLEHVDSLIKFAPANNSDALTGYKYMKSNILMEIGRPEEAVNILLDLAANVNNDKIEDSLILNSLAMAYLRMGEQNNCLNNHSVEACVFPVKGWGVHQNQEGSRLATEVYKRILTKSPNNLEARWLMNIAYMTLGEYPGGVPKEMLIPNLDADTTTVSGTQPFKDIAPQLNLDLNTMAGSVIIEDFDNDGFLDIATSGWGINDKISYFKNAGNGKFENLSTASRLDKFTGGLNMMQTDYNNDGFKDIFVLRGAWNLEQFGQQPNSLLRNNGDGTFTDVTIDAGLLSFHPTQTATWNDFNNDGWLDVFIGNESTDGFGSQQHPCEMYINNQDGTFTEIAASSHANIVAYVKGVTSGDFDKDGWQDIFVSTTSGKRFLLKNKGGKGNKIDFEDVTSKAQLDKETNRSFATWFWDYNNDGWLDIFAGDYTFNTTLAYYAGAEHMHVPVENTGQASLYRNNHDGTFTNVTKEVGLFKTAFAMGSNFGDIDNDGYLDMLLGTGNPDFRSLVPNKMFRNVDGEKFEDITTVAKVGSLQKGHAVGFGDMDNDGDRDIYIDMGGAFVGDAYRSSFFLNPGQKKNNWISLQLEGVECNRAAIGSSIKLSVTENGKKRNIYKIINSGGSFGSSPLTQEIGIGAASQIDEVEIRWNGSGKTTVFKDVAANQFIKIKEDNKKVEKLNYKKLSFETKFPGDMIPCPPITATTKKL